MAIEDEGVADKEGDVADRNGVPRSPDLMTALATEHFVLQSAAGVTVSEASSRATLYLSTLSSSLIAFGFVSQSPGMLRPFLATVLPAVVVLGLFTTVRLVDTGVQNVRYLAGIARIRGYYRHIDPAAAHYFAAFAAGPAPDADEALASLSVRRSRLTSLTTMASMIATINNLVAAVGVALAVAHLFAPTPPIVAVLAGLPVFVVGQVLFYMYQNTRYRPLHRTDPPPGT